MDHSVAMAPGKLEVPAYKNIYFDLVTLLYSIQQEQ